MEGSDDRGLLHFRRADLLPACATSADRVGGDDA
jgi:hypothetical protein